MMFWIAEKHTDSSTWSAGIDLGRWGLGFGVAFRVRCVSVQIGPAFVSYEWSGR